MFLDEVFTRIQEPVGVERNVTIKQPRTVINLCCCHVRIESGPCIDLPVSERGAPIRMLQVDEFHIVAGQTDRMQRPQRKEIRIQDRKSTRLNSSHITISYA